LHPERNPIVKISVKNQEETMPTYEYFCTKCQVIFSVVLSMAEHDRTQVECPHCHGQRVTQQYSTFFAKTSKKS
jgi:putative FmdB family regulatory protein